MSAKYRANETETLVVPGEVDVALLEKAQEAGRVIAGLFSLRSRAQPIDNVEAFKEFIATRSAFVAQKKLYGYLKTRMGTRYPSMFEDEHFIQSITIATTHIYAACLSDMTLFAAADLGAEGRLSEQQKQRLAMACYEHGLDTNADQLKDEGARSEWEIDFTARLAGVQWANIVAGGDVFNTSPQALVEWAPIAPQLKAYDREIVENSLKFAWIEIRRDYRKLIDRHAVVAELQSRA